MAKRKFKATEGLLSDVMRKQAGSVEKAVLEAVMNSVDANATEVSIIIHQDRLIIEDDGDGMSEDEVERYFEQFGLKDSDVEDKEFGKFRMGRGQIFNFGQNIWYTNDSLMVIDLDNEVTEVHQDWVEDWENEEDVIGHDDEILELDSEGLSYNWLRSSSEVDGCRIEVELYKPLQSTDETASEIRKLIRYIPWLHDIKVTVAGEEMSQQFEYDHETELAYYKLDTGGWSRNTTIYNQGAYVKKEQLTATSGTVVTKKDLDVNFARNDILDTCDVFEGIVSELEMLTRDYLLEKDDPSERERKWLLEQAHGDDGFLQQMKNKPLVPDVNDMMWSIAQLQDETITFTRKSNKLADRVKEKTGVVCLQSSYRSQVRNIIESSNMMSFEEVVDTEMKWEMEELDEDSLSKKRKDNLARARWLLREVGSDCEVRPGYSQTEEVWKTEENVVFIDKGYLKSRKSTFVYEGLIKVLEIAAHDGSTREGITHDYSFHENFWKLAKNMGEPLRRLAENKADIKPYQ